MGGVELMAAPSVVGTIAKGGRATPGTTLVLTLTAACPVGDSVVVVMGAGASQGTVSAVDSKGNTYFVTSTQAAVGGFTFLIAYATTALAISDTITITHNSVNSAAVAIDVTGMSQSMSFQTNARGGGAAIGNSGTSASAAATSLTLTQPGDDVIYLTVCTITANAVADFSSINQSYTIQDTASSTAGSNDVSIAVAYKTASAANPMVATAPTWTLANSRTWRTTTVGYSGLTDRGTVGKDISLDRLTSPAQQIAQPYSQDELEAVAGIGVAKQGGGISVITRPA